MDTGVLYALADRGDAHHNRCAKWLTSTAGPLLVPQTVVAEACYMIGTYCGVDVEAAFLDSVGAGKTFQPEALVDGDFERMAELVRRYGDLPLGGTDASVIAVAERRGSTRIATVDHRHFTVVRPRHTPALELLP
ncbi:PIN domain-containing protein [Streptosporangium sp. NPDC051022]|uniref:type II toxin-antitoxin system VapC family toxin n=1 Tax=Streptosporangium sp. NPDC051022 TaxID=3155752 RepID=UPI0034276BA6